MTTLRSGAASDVGRVRRNNQDQFLVDDPLFAVADGMGGAAGGEEASLTAVTALKVAFEADPTADGLADGVRNANRAVWEKALEHPQLRGMGTTMTAVALVPTGDDEEVLAVANVGDSRVYLFRDGRLDQITDDHSVPEELVRAGRITPEEAVSHPQRNMLTRVLGNEPEVEVDCFAIIPYSGDRLVLASDGLFNEVDHDTIAAVARRLPDPEEAAAELVRMARESGGNDNITVVVVDVVDDGDRAARASAAVADKPPSPPRSRPSARAAASGGRTAAATAAAEAEVAEQTTHVGRPAGGARSAITDVGPGAGRIGDAAPGAPAHWTSPRPQAAVDREAPVPAADRPGERRVTLRAAVFLTALVVLVAGAAAAIGFFARGGYFVGVDGDEVVIYKGRPGGLLWFDPTVADRTGVVADELTPARVEVLRSGKEEPSLHAALRYVAKIKEEASTTTTTTTTTLPPPTVAPTAATAPPAAP
ncbi:MAG TPA: protein phosphatase 2C domain-containing protein [Acidimicrobiales bacterium]|nr:protein phosphatase 2C domain-containing protein [Acidimicrobiales bacterium]